VRVPTPRGPCTIREAQPQDTPAIAALWQAAFGRPLDLDIWRWKYSGPFGAHTTVCIAPDGTLAAAFPTVPIPARVDGQPTTLELAMDSASHPAWRDLMLGRGGLFARTAQAHFAQATGRGVLGLYGFPGPRHFRLGQRLLGYQPCTGQPVLRTGTPSLPLLPWVRLVPWEPGQDLSCIHDLDARLGPPTAACRTHAFLTWRFRTHPTARYQLWLVRTVRRTVGFLVTRAGKDRTRIVDLLLPQDPGMVRASLARLAQQAHQPLELWLPATHPLTALAQGAGLSPTTEPIGATAAFRPLGPGAAALARLGYTLADTDVDSVGLLEKN